MFDHIGLRVRDLAASVYFYQAALARLGYVLCSQGEGYAGFGPAGQPALWLHAVPGAGGTGAHVALRAAGREAVEGFYNAGMDAGAHDNGKPGLRPDYGDSYFGAYLIDLDGNNVEAVCFN